MTQTKTITVQQALNELKVIDKRIERKTNETTYAGVSQKGNLVFPNRLSVKPEDFRAEISSAIDSVFDLIAYRNALKGALLVSNALTKVTVGKKEMTVAQAIDLKKSNETVKSLLYRISEDLRVANTRGENINEKVERSLQQQESDFLKGENDKNQTIIQFLRDESEKEKAELVEPNVGGKKLTEFVKNQIEQIDDFESNVDLILTTSNVTTTITVEW